MKKKEIENIQKENADLSILDLDGKMSGCCHAPLYSYYVRVHRNDGRGRLKLGRVMRVFCEKCHKTCRVIDDGATTMQKIKEIDKIVAS